MRNQVIFRTSVAIAALTPAPLPKGEGSLSSEPAEPFSQALADQFRRRVHRERQ